MSSPPLRNGVDEFLTLGDSLVASGRYEEALQAYHRALEHAPDDPAIYCAIGFVFESTSQFNEALVAYQCALNNCHSTAQLFFRLGYTLQALGRLDASYASFEQAIAVDPMHLSSHNNLGIIAKMLGHIEVARGHFERVIRIDPTFGKARDNLARLFADQGEIEDAIRIYEGSLAMNLPDSRALHLLAALREETPGQLPKENIRQLFDDFAPTFERHLVDHLAYDGPRLIRSALVETMAKAGPAQRESVGTVLDLGCGTGLMAHALEDIAEAIDGVDLAPKMIQEARRKTVYRDLFASDCAEFLVGDQGRTAQYDLLVAADVFIYFGDLTSLFSGAQGRLRPSGLFAFSVEVLETGQYALQASGRYSHSDAYIRDLARTFGFTSETSIGGDLRIEHGEPIRASFHVLRRTE